jgi:tetratricopeptide (TPR) repeat protein
MKKSLICVGLISSTLFFSFDSFAQSKNVQDAYGKFKMVSPKNDAEKNLRTLEEAKKFIDAAAENAETKEDPKMHFYRGQIYMSLYEYSAQQAMASGNVDQTLLEGYKSKAAESFIFCLNEPKKKFKDDVTGMADMKFSMMFEGGVKMYNEKKYEQALGMFFQAYDIKNMLNMDYGDSKKNGIISMNQIVERETSKYVLLKDSASTLIMEKTKILDENPNADISQVQTIIDNLIDQIDVEKVKVNNVVSFVNQIRTAFPKEVDILITLINIELKRNDLVAAERYMAEAVALDPNNKVLHYNLGTSYMSQGLNEKAEESLNKALEVDPAYKDAQYQLGAHLYNWANEVNKQAGELNSNDPKVPELEQQSEQLLQKSLNVLEKYIEINPNDKDVLGIIYKTHYKLGNSEKGKEYKARFDAQN